MKFLASIILLTSILFTYGCDELNSDSADVSGTWLIPKDQIFDGGPGKDGIPALSSPQFAPVSSINYLNANDLVIIIKIGNEVKIYPHPILNWHEIINDQIGNEKFAINYCPLTGSGMAWNRIINGKETTFGVSGLLYNSNLLPYDRLTNSNWSQMKIMSVNGPLIGNIAELYHVVETTWNTAKQFYPNANVVTTSTGFSRSYGTYPYGDYRTNNELLLFPVSPDDSRLPRKERILGVLVNNEAKAYRFQGNSNNIILTTDIVGGKQITVIQSKALNVFTAFENQLEDGTIVNLSPIQNELPIIMIDSEGNKYDLFGEIVLGPKQGKKLNRITNMIAYWFAWAAFYPNTTIEN